MNTYKLMEDMDTVIDLVTTYAYIDNNYGQDWQIRFLDAKSLLAPHFGEDGRIEIDVAGEDVILDNDELDSIVSEIIDAEHKKDKYTQQERNFLWGIFRHQFSYIIRNTIYQEELKANRLKRDIYLWQSETTVNGFELNGYNKHSFKAGIKVSKIISRVFGKMLEDRNFEEPLKSRLLDAINIIVSMVIQRISSTGTKVVLSINPLDFLLVSDHTTGWRSCHLWYDGCHKAGALSYMFDDVSAVAYAYSEKKPYENYGITTAPLPVKLWRSMVHFDLEHRSAMHCRHYSFENKLFAKFARKLSAKVLSDYSNAEYEWIYTPIKGGSANKCEIVDTGSEGMAKYGYITSGLEYQDYVTDVIKLKEGGSIPIITTGSDVICLETGDTLTDARFLTSKHKHVCCDCGESINDDDEHTYDGSIYCESCFYETYCYCSHCGEVLDKDDAESYDNGWYHGECLYKMDIYNCDDCGEWHSEVTFIDDDHCVCEDCLNRNYTYCPDCEEYYSDDFMYQAYNNGGLTSVCSDCFNEHYTQCTCGEYHHNDDVTEIDDAWLCDDCLNKSYTKCDYCNEYCKDDDIAKTQDSDFICPSCIEANYIKCTQCGIYHELDTSMEYESDFICDDCKDKNEQQEAV